MPAKEKPRCKNGEGLLFANKSTHPSAPGYTGRATVNGVPVTLSAWVNTAEKTGQKYLRIKIENQRAAQTEDQESDTPTDEPF